jgi:hypothetical protein
MRAPGTNIDPVTGGSVGGIRTAQSAAEYLTYPRPDYTLDPRLATRKPLRNSTPGISVYTAKVTVSLASVIFASMHKRASDPRPAAYLGCVTADWGRRENAARMNLYCCKRATLRVARPADRRRIFNDTVRVTMTIKRQPDSSYSWTRLAISLALSTIGGIGLWSAVVVLPAIEVEFGIGRGGASIPYTATMIGSAVGGVLLGRLADRFGIMVPMIAGALILGIGFVAAAFVSDYWQFVLIQALLIGMLGSSVTFGPLVAEVSLWFVRQRGIAIAIVASGNYLAGTIWPPLLQPAIQSVGWRFTYLGIGIFCAATMLPLAFLLRERAPVAHSASPASKSSSWR